MNKALAAAIVAAILIGGALLYVFKRDTRQEKFETALIDRGDITEKITATGTINPVNSVKVGSQVTGRIVKIFADYNAHVKKGQVIAQLETDLYQSKVDQAEANYKMSQAQVLEARASLIDAESNFKRAKKLRAEQVLAERDFEIAETKYAAAQAAYQAAVARERQSQALLNAANVDLAHTTIYSPVDGIVISRNCDVGQTVVATFQTPDLFLIAEDLTKMQVDAYVDEADIGKVQVGQEAQFTVDSYPDTVFSGTISQVRFAPKELQNVVSYATVIEVANPELKLRPGMTASITIIAGRKMNVLRVVNAALRFKPDPEDKDFSRDDQASSTQDVADDAELAKRQRLWVLAADNTVHREHITTGIYDTRYTEIVAGRVTEGQKVIVGYQPQWRKADSSRGSFFRFGARQ